MDTDLLHATPEDATPDSGPRRHGGLLVLLAALIATFAALFAASLAHQLDRTALIAPALLLFGLPSLWWWWCVASYWRDRTPLPSSHSILAGALGFDLICTCRGVAATVFFHPDQKTAGDDFGLFVFVENYTSRCRSVEVRIGPHPGLGLPHLHSVHLHLAAGQAAVYRLTLRPDTPLHPGAHDLPVVLRVKSPQGAGRRLPGTPRHLHDIWHTRFAAPFTIEASNDTRAPAAPSSPVPPPAYVTLASVSETLPRLETLPDVVQGL